MIHKKSIFIFLLLFMFLIAGCQNAGTSGSWYPFGKSPSQPKDLNVFTGTNGLTIEFAKNAPPPKVIENSDFPVLLTIRNIGAYSISKNEKGPGFLGALISIGRERDYIPAISFEKNSRLLGGGTDNEAFFYIDGKTQINQKGEELIVPINAKTGKLDPQSENKQSAMSATLCYPYKTVLSATACIDPDVAGMRPGKKACTVKDLVYNNGQGAPIAVTKIEPLMIPVADKEMIKPQFLIYVENKGKGTPVNIVGFHNICRNIDLSKEEVKYTWNVAALKAYTSGKESNQLICCPNIDGECPESEMGNIDKISGFIRLRDKKDFVRCTFKNGVPKNSDAFTSPLKIEIDYGYVQTATANFMIQKPLRY
ncbi:MAG: hypothetical protein AABX33_04530 [Nanoarchaeota archaeon]